MIAPLLSVILFLATVSSQQQSVRFNPQVVSVVRDSTGYVQSMVSVFSVSGDSIRITDIKGSCGCATASVQRPLMHDSVPGNIYLSINANHFTDSLNYVDYQVTHTGAGSPAGYRVVVRVPKEKR